jgi:hypothetical protein
MKHIVISLLTCFGLLLACSSRAELTGTTVGEPLSCFVQTLSTDAKALLNRWIALNEKAAVRAITDAELEEGRGLNFDIVYNPTGKCGSLPEGILVTVVVLDGTDYLIRTQDQNYIIKAEGFQADGGDE